MLYGMRNLCRTLNIVGAEKIITIPYKFSFTARARAKLWNFGSRRFNDSLNFRDHLSTTNKFNNGPFTYAFFFNNTVMMCSDSMYHCTTKTCRFDFYHWINTTRPGCLRNNSKNLDLCFIYIFFKCNLPTVVMTCCTHVFF